MRRWWRDSEIAEQNFYRKRHVELYFWVVTCISEPQFSQSRIAFAKITTVGTVLDDLYDSHGKLDELRTITKGVRRWIQIIDFLASFQLSLLYTSKIFIFIIAGAIFRWDLSVIDDFPDDIKISLQFFFNTANELAVEVVKNTRAGYDSYIKRLRMCI